MEVVTTLKQMREIVLRLRKAGKRIALVPTMGALHEGHLSLVREARKRSGLTIVSLFVNPTQFGPNEDFKKYPRDLERDRKMCETEKVDYLLAPDAAEMYLTDHSTHVAEEAIASHMEGASRPAHFRGVCTVVAKLFHITQPDIAVFGQKDAQQVAVIQRMVRDLNFSVEIVVIPIVREPDGLAMSSRNAFLDPEDRHQALVLRSALAWALEALRKGQKKSDELRVGMLKIILYAPRAKVDYVEFVNAATWERVSIVEKGTLILLAIWIGKTRLIDNALVE